MNIAIQPTTPDQIRDFEVPLWAAADRQHYGQEVDWDSWAGERFLFKAVHDDQPVGMIAGHLTAGVVYIIRVITHPDHRRSGVATQLLTQSETWARDHGAHLIYLDTGKHWGLGPFYEKRGYTLTGEIPNYYHHQDFVIYTKSLN